MYLVTHSATGNMAPGVLFVEGPFGSSAEAQDFIDANWTHKNGIEIHFMLAPMNRKD